MIQLQYMTVNYSLLISGAECHTTTLIKGVPHCTTPCVTGHPRPTFSGFCRHRFARNDLFYKVKLTQSNYTYCDKSIGKSNSKRKINAIRNYPCQIEYSGSNHFYRSPFSSCSPNTLTSATVEVAEGAVLSTLSTGIALGTCGQLLLIHVATRSVFSLPLCRSQVDRLMLLEAISFVF